MSLEDVAMAISIVIYSLLGFILFSKGVFGGGASASNFTRTYTKNHGYFEWERWLGFFGWQLPVIIGLISVLGKLL